MFEPGDAVGPADLLAESSAVGVDRHTDEIQHARLALFAPKVAEAARQAAGDVLETPMRDATASLESFMPWVFRAMEVRRSDAPDDGPAYGYIRIFTFSVPNATAFVDEFARLAGLLPDDGLIIDVRGNGGGLIYAAEQLLQLLTPEADRAAAGAVRQHAAQPAHLPQAPPVDTGQRARPRAVDRVDRAGDTHGGDVLPRLPDHVADRRQRTRSALPRPGRPRHRRARATRPPTCSPPASRTTASGR